MKGWGTESGRPCETVSRLPKWGRHPSPPFPFQLRAPLSSSRDGASVTGLAHPVLSQKPGEQAWEVAMLSEARQEATD